MARYHKETMRERIARLESEVSNLSSERAELFSALEKVVEAANAVSATRACAPSHPVYAAREEGRRVLHATCRCSCGRHVGYEWRPRMCERCLSS